MQRRQFLATGVATAFSLLVARRVSAVALAPWVVAPLYKDFDASQIDSPLVSWKEQGEEYPGSKQSGEREAVGLVEGMATEDLLPILLVSMSYIPDPWNFRDTSIGEAGFPRTGIYFRVALSINPKNLHYIDPITKKLTPREEIHGPESLVRRKYIPFCEIKFDHRAAVLRTSNAVFKADPLLWNAPLLGKAVDKYQIEEGQWLRDRPLVPVCNRDDRRGGRGTSIIFTMRFDCGPIQPNRFRVELPPVEYLGNSIPLPVMIFEAYRRSAVGRSGWGHSDTDN